MEEETQDYSPLRLAGGLGKIPHWALTGSGRGLSTSSCVGGRRGKGLGETWNQGGEERGEAWQ